MILMHLCVDNFYSFNKFEANFSYPRKIANSSIASEHIVGFPNFRYKKVNIIMGANSTGKTTMGKILMRIFNFIKRKNISQVTDYIADRSKEASFQIDIVSEDTLYRIDCRINPKDKTNLDYQNDDVKVKVRSEKIRTKDSYESCVSRLETQAVTYDNDYINELEPVTNLSWKFKYPLDDGPSIASFPENRDNSYLKILKNVFQTFDPSISDVKKVPGIEDAYAIHFPLRKIVIQEGDEITNMYLSSGTKSVIDIANMIYSIKKGMNAFYYCDELFSFVNSDIEKAVLSLMIECLHDNEQLFFTTHNPDILDMDLPKHSFMFMKKVPEEETYCITSLSAADFLKRNTDSVRCAVENDLFSIAPEIDKIFEIREL